MHLRSLLVPALIALLAAPLLAGAGAAQTCPDADGDGLDACLETAQGTSDALVDTDGDALSDHLESASYPGRDALFCGRACAYPDPLKKDVYVEMDHMGADHLPTDADLDRIVQVYATSPNAGNPDGSEGIRLHLDAGPSRAAKYDLGGGTVLAHQNNLGGTSCYNWGEFDTVKNANFRAERHAVYHYMVWAHNLGTACGSTSGISRGIPASDFIVSLGGWSQHGNANARVGTFLHEIGHNVGLKHGGTDHVNYKPNYLSVMNYFFQTSGVPRTTGDADFGYSRFALPTLREAALDESAGLGTDAAGYATRWSCTTTQLAFTREFPVGGPIDWNCDVVIEPIPVAADVNYSGFDPLGVGLRVYPCVGASPATCQTLTTQRDWGTLVYDGGAVGGLDAALPTEPPVTDWLTEELDDHLHGR